MFDFLNNFTVQPNEEKVATSKGGAKGGTTKQERNPTNGASLRLFKDGRVYPSAALVAAFNLEYTDIATKGGNGFDITESSRWSNTRNNPNTCVFISAIPKAAAKVDLFGSVGYYGPNDTLPEGKNLGDAMNSVLEQGPATFGKKLIVMICEAYGLTEETLFGEKNNVDLFIAESNPIRLPDGIYYLPKQISSGEQKGEWTTTRRENITMFPLVVFKPEYVASTTTEVVEEPALEETVESTVEETELSEVQ